MRETNTEVTTFHTRQGAKVETTTISDSNGEVLEQEIVMSCNHDFRDFLRAY